MKVVSVLTAVAMICSLFLFAPPILAHHSFAAEFDANKCRDFTGTLTKLDWQSPHAYFYLDIKNEAGKVENWSFQTYALITLNRPPANAISEQLITEVNAALNAVQSDDSVRAVIVTGAGDKIFCGGADLASAFSGGDVEQFIRFGNSVMRKLERFPKPVIAAINGHAMGGGMEIAMACHLRLMKESARMGQTESNLGIIPGYGGTQRLPRLVGRTKALEYLLLGTQIPAAECLALGLVNRLSKEGETLNDAKALARQLGGRAPLAMAAIIRAVDEGLEAPMAKSIDIELEQFLPTLRSEDASEGIQAFFAKREPHFKGK